jgi:N-acetylglucosamine-6-sulfatase
MSDNINISALRGLWTRSEAGMTAKASIKLLAAIVGLLLLLWPATAQGPNVPQQPNIVFILTDDLSLNLVPYMPHVLQMRQNGVTFTNYFVADSLCCPSRASIFTGRYPHNTGVLANVGPSGGYDAFRLNNMESASFAETLSAAGYQTAMLGKYLNGYQPTVNGPDPGWSYWAAAGYGYNEFDYDLNQNGQAIRYGDEPADYLTDVISGLAANFIQRARQPYFVEVATFAPHKPYVPAPRDANEYPNLRLPRTPTFNAAPPPDAPAWLARITTPLNSSVVADIEKFFRLRVQSVMAVDQMIGNLQALVASLGQQNNTIFVFSSDNGYHMGEYRLLPGKMTAFDTDIHVPLVMTGPGIKAGSLVSALAQNVDLAPTFIELAGATPSTTTIDGRSLVQWVYPSASPGNRPPWRAAALVEHKQVDRIADDPDIESPVPRIHFANPPTYQALRTLTATYVEYVTGEKEYHDLSTDPYELVNTYESLDSTTQTNLHEQLSALHSCQGSSC